MTREEAKTIFLNRGYIEVDGGSYFDGNKWRESITVISEWLKEEPCEVITRIPKDYLYDTETEDVLVYRHKYTGKEIHIEKPVKRYRIEPCEDVISRQAVNTLVDELARAISDERCFVSRGRSTATIMQDILDLPPVNPQEPKTDMLDKIRAEIESNIESVIGIYDSSIPKSNMPSYKIERNKVRKECISIIDKYKAESEEVMKNEW